MLEEAAKKEMSTDQIVKSQGKVKVSMELEEVITENKI